MRVACISHGSIVPLNRRPYDILHDQGMEITILLPDRWLGDLPNPDLRYAPDLRGAPVLPLRGRGTGNTAFFSLDGLATALRRLAPDVVVLDEEPWSVVAYQTLRAGLPGPMVCYTKQNISKLLPPPFNWFRRATYRRVSSVWAVGEAVVPVVRTAGYEGPVEVIPHGVETSLFTPGRDESRRMELGLDGVVIGYAGRLVTEKGVRDLLEAAAQVARATSVPPFSVLIVGSGPLASFVKRASIDGPLAGRVHHLPAVPHHAAPGLYRLMDVFVLPSRTTRTWREQFGRALVEAGATRLPIVATDSGEIPFVLRGLGGGIVVPEGDTNALAGALRQLLVDPERRALMGSTNLESARRQYTHEAVADQMRLSLERVTAGVARR